MPKLETMVVEVSNHGSFPSRERGLLGAGEILLGGAPALRFVNFRGCALQALCPPLTGVTTLHFHMHRGFQCTLREFGDLLERLHSLCDCSLAQCTVRPPDGSAPDTLIRIPSLQFLTITLEPVSIFQYLSAPALRMLAIVGVPKRQVQKFLESWIRTGLTQYPNLEVLSLTRFEGNEKRDWEQLFERVPTLRRLTMSNEERHTGVALAALAGISTFDLMLLPNLEALPTLAVPRDALVEFIMSRCTPIGRSPFHMMACHPGFVNALERDYGDAIAWMMTKGVVLEGKILNPSDGAWWPAFVRNWASGPSS